MNTAEFIAFLLAAIALLGSPGPAIAALLAVGRNYGWGKGLGFFWGLQLGLASAAGITILGFFAVLQAFPWTLTTMSIIATAYLLYLAFKIATSASDETQTQSEQSPRLLAGTLLGITNPKAYVAFASLFASFQIFANSSVLDSTVKWVGVVIVMVLVDAAWLGIGVKLGELNMSAQSEKLMNYALAGAIVLAAGLGLV